VSLIRRFYMAVISVAVIVGLTFFWVAPQSVSSWAGTVSEIPSLVRIAIAAVLDVLLLVLLYIQVKPDPRRQVTGLMMQASGAITEVSVDSARARILKAVNEVPDIVSADADVKPIHGKADVELHVTVMSQQVQLPAKQKEINRALNQVIHKQLGLRLAGQPRVHIQFYGEEEIVRPAKPIVALEPTKPVTAVIPEKPAAVESELAKPAETFAPVKPVEPEPQKLLGLFSRPRHDEANVEDKADIPPMPVVKSDEESVSQPTPDADQEDDTLKLNVDDEIAHSATDDIVVSEPVEKSEDSEEKEVDSRSVSLNNNHLKESEPH
jgi:hypothetical protein